MLGEEWAKKKHSALFIEDVAPETQTVNKEEFLDTIVEPEDVDEHAVDEPKYGVGRPLVHSSKHLPLNMIRLHVGHFER